MKFLIIADPVQKLKPQFDTGLCMLRESLARGHEVALCQDGDVCLLREKVFAQVSWVKKCAPLKTPIFRKAAFLDITEFDGIWVRRDPPFDAHYLTLCWMLSLVEKQVSILNPPKALLRCHEKLTPFLAYQAGFLKQDELIPTWLSFLGQKKFPNAIEFLQSEVVSKPWLGYGGSGVRKWRGYRALIQGFLKKAKERFLVQPLIKDIGQVGDRRVFYIDGQYQGDFVRIPGKGKIVSNLAQGGSAISVPLTESQKDLVQRMGDYLKSEGIVLAGVDMIANYISEVNITAPTGFVKFKEMYGIDLTQRYVDLAEKRCARTALGMKRF